MNEIHSYDPEMYHATLTHSVYVRLEGSVLRLSKPNRNISRRATHNEPKPDITYISQKIYDLTDSKVCLFLVYAWHEEGKRDAETYIIHTNTFVCRPVKYDPLCETRKEMRAILICLVCVSILAPKNICVLAFNLIR